MGDIAHGVDNLQPDGSFYCDGHSGGFFGSDRMGGARWETDRWKRGTKPNRNYVSFYCSNGHISDVTAPRWDSEVEPPTRCYGKKYPSDEVGVPCGSTDFRKSGGGSIGENADCWPYDTIIPRTCSFCGSVHPEDLIELTKHGFAPEGTTKGYKYYVNGPDGRSLLPPIKFYTNHVNPDLIAKLNAALDEYRRGPRN